MIELTKTNGNPVIINTALVMGIGITQNDSGTVISFTDSRCTVKESYDEVKALVMPTPKTRLDIMNQTGCSIQVANNVYLLLKKAKAT